MKNGIVPEKSDWEYQTGLVRTAYTEEQKTLSRTRYYVQNMRLMLVRLILLRVLAQRERITR